MFRQIGIAKVHHYKNGLGILYNVEILYDIGGVELSDRFQFDFIQGSIGVDPFYSDSLSGVPVPAPVDWPESTDP